MESLVRLTSKSIVLHPFIGFMRDREDKSEIPDLIEQEREALSALSTVLFRLYTESKDQAEKERNLNEFLE